jgi:hypothetical protein
VDARHLILIVRAVGTDDHRGRYVGRLEVPAPLRDLLTVTGEHDCLRRIRRHVHRDLPAAVVLERLGDELSRYPISTSWFRRRFGTTGADGCLVIHRSHLDLSGSCH